MTLPDTFPHPREQTLLFGHDAAEAKLTHALEADKLAHAWILSGGRGIGKATFAYRMARRILSPGYALPEPENPVFRRIAAQSHSDLLTVESEGEITVDQTRSVKEFMAHTPAEGRWRVVIVDGAEAMNLNAANALLKVLEEPPAHAVIFLVAHHAGALLPTIRSRCHLLKLMPPDDNGFMAAMRALAPEAGEKEVKAVALLSGNAPGLALHFLRHDATGWYRRLMELAGSLPAIDMRAIHGFAEKVGSRAEEEAWGVVTQMALTLFYRAALPQDETRREILAGEAELLHKLQRLIPPSGWAARWEAAGREFHAAERLYLDKKQVMLTLMENLQAQAQ